MLKPAGGTSVTITADFVNFGTGNGSTGFPKSRYGLLAPATPGSSPHTALNKVPSIV